MRIMDVLAGVQPMLMNVQRGSWCRGRYKLGGIVAQPGRSCFDGANVNANLGRSLVGFDVAESNSPDN